MLRYLVILLVIQLIGACQRRQPEQAITKASVSQKADSLWVAQKAKINAQLTSVTSTADSLSIILQFVASHADGGMEGHTPQTYWQHLSIAEKFRLCEYDSIKLLCGASCDYLVDCIYEFTPWQAFSYTHGKEEGMLHVTTLVNVRGKLLHADPLFGHIAYDAKTDTMLDFMNEIRLLKAGKHNSINYKVLDFETDVLVCEDSVSILKFVNQFYEAIGPDDWQKKEKLIYSSNGICPYKLKSKLTLQRWATIERGGLPYVKWLNTKGHSSIGYLVLYPLHYNTYTKPGSNEVAIEAFSQIRLLTDK